MRTTAHEILHALLGKRDDVAKRFNKIKSALRVAVCERISLLRSRIHVLLRQRASADFSAEFAVVQAPFFHAHGAHPPHPGSPALALAVN